MRKCNLDSRRYILHKTKLYPRLQAIKEFKEEYTAEVELKLASMQKIGNYQFVNIVENEALKMIKPVIESKEVIADDQIVPKAAKHVELPEGLKAVCYKSELEKEFDYRQEAFQFYREKKNMVLAKKKDMVISELFPTEVVQSSSVVEIKTSKRSSPISTRNRALSVKNYMWQNNMKHVENIEIEKSLRKKRLRISKLEGRYCLSDLELSSQKNAIDNLSAATEQIHKTVSRSGSRSTGRDFIHRRVRTEGQGWFVRNSTLRSSKMPVHDLHSSTGFGLKKEKTLHYHSRASSAHEVKKLKTVNSRTDSFSRACKIVRNPEMDLNDGMNQISQVMTEPSRPKTSNFVPGKIAESSRKKTLMASKDMLATSIASIDKLTEVSILPSKETPGHSGLQKKSSSDVNKRNFLAESIFSFCKERVAEKRHRQLYRKINLKKNEIGIN